MTEQIKLIPGAPCPEGCDDGAVIQECDSCGLVACPTHDTYTTGPEGDEVTQGWEYEPEGRFGVSGPIIPATWHCGKCALLATKEQQDYERDILFASNQ